jgi:outer membrane protein with beta-barrel domain
MFQSDSRLVAVLVAAAVLSLVSTASASAQSRLRPYAGASLGSIDVDSDDVDGRSASMGFVAGVTVSRYVDLEFEAGFPASGFTRTFTGVLVYAPPPGTPREDIERWGVVSDSEWRREVRAVLSGVAIIHPAATGRVVPALVAGVTAQRARRIHRTTPLVIPAGIDPQSPAVVAHEERLDQTIGAPTIGGQLSIRVTPRLYLVPDVRYDYGSIGDEINNALRTSVRAIWRF